MAIDILSPCGKVGILSSASVVGKKEKEGPLGETFDLTCKDARFEQKTFEAAESEMQHMALNMAFAKAKINDTTDTLIIAGDLLNQCTGSTYGLTDFDSPYLGIFGACSTMAEGLILGAMAVGAGYVKTAAAVTSSHFCSAERQFRLPLEYGGQRTPTSQWTVTGAGAYILKLAEENEKNPYIAEMVIGKIVDPGIDDPNNMGAAMAPAAADTILRYFQNSPLKPEDFDMIATGDLGYEGAEILKDLTAREGIDIAKTYNDCGLMIFDLEQDDVHAGASGCGCSAVVSAGLFMNNLRGGLWKNILLIGTGALMSPGAMLQKNTIPGIAHLVRICI